ncbi:MAG: hypothetical protein RLY71_1122 [Pseudomonadota bacterium]
MAASALLLLPVLAGAAENSSAAESDVPTKSLGVVTITGRQPSSLPTQIPTTMETITREKIEQTVNAVDSEDVLKYFPSLLVRKRYNDDYNHAILSTRASGTGNSARSMVYADGIVLSNLLGNGVGGLSFPPRWNMVTPEEIDRVTVMYGPFSAAYPGNSAGAVVDYVTRMPTRLEGHVAIGYVDQPFELYSTRAHYKSWQTSASLGSRSGGLAWWLNVSHTDSEGQPLTFPTRLQSAAVAACPTGTTCTPVTGAVQGANNTNAPWLILGAGTQYHTRQDHLRLKLAYDVTPEVRASYTLGLWQNESEGRPTSYLRDASGQPVYSGAVSINGQIFAGTQALGAGDFALTNQRSTHYMHGLSVKSHTRSTWDWEVVASLYDYADDTLRQNGTALPGAASGGAGTIADGSGSGWNTLGFKGTWRPDGIGGAHIADFGLQQDSYKLAYLTSRIAGNWLSDGPGALASDVEGRTRLRSLWAQDTWAFAPDWKTVLGLRFENWSAYNGLTVIPASSLNTSYARRSENHLSPKAAVSWQLSDDTVLKASVGRAVRFPTVAELYGATSTTNSQYINDPKLKPETSWTSEWSAEKDLGNGTLRATFFTENVHDSLYSQTVFDAGANKNISRVQNVGRIQTNGLELAWRGDDVLMHGLDLSSSVTYADSVIKDNAGFVSVAGDTIGKQQPNIPKWRATALATYRFGDAVSVSYGARYSGPQYRTLNNADVNGYTYQGVSKFFTTDLRVLWHINRQFTASAGIDNLNNYQYWNFHPYPQRSYAARLQANF